MKRNWNWCGNYTSWSIKQKLNWKLTLQITRYTLNISKRAEKHITPRIIKSPIGTQIITHRRGHQPLQTYLPLSAWSHWKNEVVKGLIATVCQLSVVITYIHRFKYINTFHGCTRVSKTVECRTSDKYVNINNLYSVK
jgi:hypothetical protein